MARSYTQPGTADARTQDLRGALAPSRKEASESQGGGGMLLSAELPEAQEQVIPQPSHLASTTQQCFQQTQQPR